MACTRAAFAEISVSTSRASVVMVWYCFVCAVIRLSQRLKRSATWPCSSLLSLICEGSSGSSVAAASRAAGPAAVAAGALVLGPAAVVPAAAAAPALGALEPPEEALALPKGMRAALLPKRPPPVLAEEATRAPAPLAPEEEGAAFKPVVLPPPELNGRRPDEKALGVLVELAWDVPRRTPSPPNRERPPGESPPKNPAPVLLAAGAPNSPASPPKSPAPVLLVAGALNSPAALPEELPEELPPALGAKAAPLLPAGLLEELAPTPPSPLSRPPNRPERPPSPPNIGLPPKRPAPAPSLEVPLLDASAPNAAPPLFTPTAASLPPGPPPKAPAEVPCVPPAAPEGLLVAGHMPAAAA
mmetsp:Transcript_107249/g.346055  ORF Transcript_107249/g.346055 Transcript_107249/m.346055 type:complete len:357 (-) Transcript_107249:36-1106(-)